jgi:thiamine-monophosphate kinase
MPGANEFELIERYFSTDVGSDVLLGIGDDAAIIDVREPIVVAVDTLVGGVHFPPDLAARSVGHRALAVNLSDLAAMGAKPRWATLALTLPAADERWIDEFAGGFFALAERYGVSLVGGDTTRGPVTITVQLIGTLVDGAALKRSGGRGGDDVYVTGTLGDSAAAVPILARDSAARTPAQDELVERFCYPSPRVAAGIALAPLAHAAIDISDGLVADLGHLCKQSACGALIDIERLPLSPALQASCSASQAEDFALGGGDDYELCFTAPPERAADVAAALQGSQTAFTRIGRLTEAGGVTCLRSGHPVSIRMSGYSHF